MTAQTLRGALLTNNLPQLQNLIKRDPQSYKEEFLQQWTHFGSVCKIVQHNPEDQVESFREAVSFLSQVAHCYPDITTGFPDQLVALLKANYGRMTHDVKKNIISNLVILRNRNIITSIYLLKALFPILSQTVSSLRSFVRKVILSEIRSANAKHKNHQLNRAVQSILFGMIDQGTERKYGKGKGPMVEEDKSSLSYQEPLWAVTLTAELWKRGIWNDARAVSIMSMGCLHPVMKVQKLSMHFFMGHVEEQKDSDNEDDEGQKKATLNSGATLHLLNDPQTFAEKLYDNLVQNEKFYPLDHKILFMDVLSRAMSIHKLCILGFYSYIIKYLTYHQLRIPAILASLAQSVHELTPPDVLTPVIRKIAQEFVHPGVNSEVIAAGINAIREVCSREPWCMEEDLLSDLIEYRKSKDKAVIAASRSLLGLYRTVNPAMLKRRERGKEASTTGATKQALPYGYQSQSSVGIEGLSLLQKHKEANPDEEADENNWKDWEVASETSESSEEGWIDVSSDGEGAFDLSDSDDEDKLEEKETDDNPQNMDFATTTILTPADFALMEELKSKTKDGDGGGTKAKKRKHGANAGAASQTEQSIITEYDILGPRKKAKATYDERMASIQGGREGREKFGSHKGKKNKEAPSSSTNREKARNKPIMMVMASGAVRSKKKASLKEKQKRLRQHIDRAKKAYR